MTAARLQGCVILALTAYSCRDSRGIEPKALTAFPLPARFGSTSRAKRGAQDMLARDPPQICNRLGGGQPGPVAPGASPPVTTSSAGMVGTTIAGVVGAGAEVTGVPGTNWMLGWGEVAAGAGAGVADAVPGTNCTLGCGVAPTVPGGGV